MDRGSGETRRWREALAGATLLLMLAVGGCDEKADEAGAPPPPPPSVIAAPVTKQDLTASTQFIGRVEAIDKVDLRARVTGFLEERRFEEGRKVAKGDVLFVIEKAPYEAVVNAAKAALAEAEASYAEAKAFRARNEQAVKTGAVSRQQLDEAIAQEQVAAAKILAAKADLQTAELDLGYTEIAAPVNGIIGQAKYTVGNLVGPDSDVLATIVSQDPIHVTFPISREVVLEYQKRRAEVEGYDAGVLVRLQMADGTIYEHPGEIDFADIQISPTTDTLLIRAEFPNPKNFLIDGQFSPVFVESEEPQQALFVPLAAIQADQAGRFVLIVDAENKVQVRRVTVGAERDGKTEITEGLTEGELIVVQGIQKVRPGQVVTATPAESSGSPPGGAGAEPATAPADGGAGQ